ncbi:hypothetical protein D3C86_2070400 [compost metagenome]
MNIRLHLFDDRHFDQIIPLVLLSRCQLLAQSGYDGNSFVFGVLVHIADKPDEIHIGQVIVKYHTIEIFSVDLVQSVASRIGYRELNILITKLVDD